jgi:transposase InsO family protein
VVGQHRTTQRHQPADPDAALRAWLRAYAKDHPRRGFRPAYHDARDEGWIVNHKKIQRLWREEGLRVPQRRRRKRHGASTAPPAVTANAPDRVWAVGFQFDVTTDGRPIKIISIIDRTHPRMPRRDGRAQHHRRTPPNWTAWPPSAARSRRCFGIQPWATNRQPTTLPPAPTE